MEEFKEGRLLNAYNKDGVGAVKRDRILNVAALCVPNASAGH
jgi:hypothetical protein